MLFSMLVRKLFFAEPNDISMFVLGLVLRDFFFPGFTILVALFIIVPAAKYATRPLIAVSDAAKRIAQGDFSTRLPAFRSNDEVSGMASDFNTMAEELERNQLLKKDFAARISHQFKTPLSVITGYSRLLEEDGISDEERKKYAALITRESQRLASLSANILRLSKLESQGIIVSPAKFLLDEQIIQTILRLEPKWSRKNISFNIDLQPTYFFGDEELLSHVWFNIADNAVKYTGDGGEIAVVIEEDSSSLTVTFADSGIGMDSETQQNAFSDYYRGPSSVEGTGLGLSIVKRIVELHDGSVRIESSPNCGCTVSVVLPKRDAEM